jgi:serine phosphatase RsbU (regulator of sigma subunit)
VLGIESDPLLEDRRVELAAGDVLIAYTDGLTDAYAPRRISTADDVAAVLAGCADLGASEIAQRITAAMLSEGSGRPRDDILLLVLRIPSGAAAAS